MKGRNSIVLLYAVLAVVCLVNCSDVGVSDESGKVILHNLEQKIEREADEVLNGVGPAVRSIPSRTYYTAISIFFGSILASAAGIGGGGVFVALLIFIGHFDVWYAVPLSKAMIFTGSLISGYLNVKKRHPDSGGSIINMDLVRLIVPSALCGTFIGVFLNGILNQIVIVLLLFIVLSTVTFRTFISGSVMYREESRELAKLRRRKLLEDMGEDCKYHDRLCDNDGIYDEGPSISSFWNDTDFIEESLPAVSNGQDLQTGGRQSGQTNKDTIKPNSIRSVSLQPHGKDSLCKTEYHIITQKEGSTVPCNRDRTDLSIMVFHLLLTISSGVILHETLNCVRLSLAAYAGLTTIALVLMSVTIAIQVFFARSMFRAKDRAYGGRGQMPTSQFDKVSRKPGYNQFVKHRAPETITPTTIEDWGDIVAHSSDIESAVEYISISDDTPLAKSGKAILPPADQLEPRSAQSDDKRELKVDLKAVISYPLISLFAGILSGLLGIGGGLIFSPFMVAMMVDPVVAVATAATCVIFTSSSTTFQYLLIGRVIIHDAIFYGCLTTIASYIGVKLVHWIGERFNRKSFVIFIVGAAVALSSCLTIAKVILLASADLN